MEAAEPGSAPAWHNSATISALAHAPKQPSEKLRPQPPPQAPSRQHTQYRDGLERSQQDRPAMAAATATVLQPAGAYPPAPSYSSTYTNQAGGMMPLADARRGDGLEPTEAAKRQSLPSLSEVINKNPDYPRPHPPSAGPAPPATSIQPGTNFPSPYAPSGSLRSYADSSSKHTSPQNMRSASTYPPRPEPLSSFAESPRPALNGRPILPPVPSRRPSPPQHHDVTHSYGTEQPKDPRQSVNGVYQHPPPPAPPQHLSSATSGYPTGPPPPGQLPLPPFQSPRQTHMAFESYEHRRQPEHEGHDRVNRVEFEGAPYSDTIVYREGLARMANHAKTLLNFADAYSGLAREEHGSHPIPERMPTEKEINDVVSYVDAIKADLDSVKHIMYNAIQNREQPPRRAYAEDHDAAVYEESMKFNHQTVLPEKRKRGRVAPPGRCHSCNRVDTPEWRRGPDGARTLCNACGLHYAKLERKRLIEQRTIAATIDAGN
ncbi:GATA-type sexual development transcription factor NsdD [Emericellopsis cladophorae]|uniref:GATA-type sexual development transcription factor NsdD n=1 Tax=Emericellopsis cladophorae TaxID=2686198 RepID=A0A9P9Y2X1_9HYPO|nr:GATA-type sexual development transcription factor NsdD [Emericellopsis cladophorae]KAI6782100.1 GATA-type sexual development transcription factor NsdD [Emericellopsis cladophorae]